MLGELLSSSAKSPGVKIGNRFHEHLPDRCALPPKQASDTMGAHAKSLNRQSQSEPCEFVTEMEHAGSMTMSLMPQVELCYAKLQSMVKPGSSHLASNAEA